MSAVAVVVAVPVLMVMMMVAAHALAELRVIVRSSGGCRVVARIRLRSAIQTGACHKAAAIRCRRETAACVIADFITGARHFGQGLRREHHDFGWFNVDNNRELRIEIDHIAVAQALAFFQ